MTVLRMHLPTKQLKVCPLNFARNFPLQLCPQHFTGARIIGAIVTGDSSSEEDNEYSKYRAAIADRIENAKKAGYILKEPAAISLLGNEKALEDAGYDFSFLVKEGSNIILKRFILKAITEIETAKVELGKQDSWGSHEFNCDSQSQEDDKSGDYVGDSNNTQLKDMTDKELSDIIATKSALKDVHEEEKKVGPINITFKHMLDAAKAEGNKEKGKSIIKKVQAVMGTEEFKNLTVLELKLLSDVALASVRKIELPGIISSLEVEIESVKEARRVVKVKDAELKEAILDEKKKEVKKRQLEAMKPTPRKK